MRESDAEDQRVEAVNRALHHDRRARHPGKQTDEGRGQDAEIGKKAAMPQHGGIKRQHLAERKRRAGRLFQSLRQQQRRDRAGNAGKDHQQHECRAPAECGLQHAADGRGDDRREGGDRSHDRQFAARPRTGINVAHHRARQHDDAGAAERLHEAQRDQPVDRLRQGAADAGEAVEHQRRQQDRFAADAVRNRSVKNLADGKAEQITGNGQLHVEDRRMQSPRDVRQRRQIHVHRQRAERGQKRQHKVRANVPGVSIAMNSPLERK